MKKPVLLFLVVGVAVSCSDYLEIFLLSGTRLVSVEYTDEYDKEWTETYTYSSEGRLMSIEDSRLSGRRHEVVYEGSTIKEYLSYGISDGRLLFRDSVLYNPDGTIHAVYKFSINSGEGLPLSRIYEFEYDDNEKVVKKSNFFVSTQEYTSEERFYWKGDNIERSEYYYNDELRHEFFYEYDNAINYKKGMPQHIINPIDWGKHNVKKTDWKDYSGVLHISCKPCLTDYRYNVDGYPTEIRTNWGTNTKLTYDD